MALEFASVLAIRDLDLETTEPKKNPNIFNYLYSKNEELEKKVLNIEKIVYQETAKVIIKQKIKSSHGVLFFCILWNICWGEDVENGSKLKLYIFFEMLEDSGCKFKLNFDGEGVKNSEKSQNSKKNCIKSFDYF